MFIVSRGKTHSHSIDWIGRLKIEFFAESEMISYNYTEFYRPNKMRILHILAEKQ